MVEQRDIAPQESAYSINLDYRRTLVAAGRKLNSLDLSGQEKNQLLITVSDTLFPKKAGDLKTKIEVGNDECKKSIESVFNSPRLFVTFQDLVSQLTDDPRQLDIIRGVHYKNKWEKGPKLKRGEQERRLQIVLDEHRERYPGVPVNLTSLGQAIGGAVRQRVWHLWNALEAKGKIPEGLTKLPSGYKPRKKSA